MCACKEHTHATTHTSTGNVHKVHTVCNPPTLMAMLVPAIKLIITTNNIMVAKLAATPSLKLVS